MMVDSMDPRRVLPPPSPGVVRLARRLSIAALSKTHEPEITVDVDGAVSFDLRLANGMLMFAELKADGTLNLSVLDDRGQDARVVRHLPSATESEFVDQL